jgi:LysR family hydrogen peroxide-inducible transcriptional activator
MVSIQQIQYLVILEEERHFVRASERCFITQPTLSMQVKKAEESLGRPVFDRSRNPMTLTSFGKELLPVLKNVLGEYDQIERLIKQENGTFKEEVSIGIIPTIAAYLVPDLYPNWMQQFKEMGLLLQEMKTEDGLLALERKEIDVFIMAGPYSSPGFRTTTLYEEVMKIYLSNESSNEVTTNELSALKPWLLNKGNCLRSQMLSFCDVTEPKKSDHWDYQGGNVDVLMKMVDVNGGYTLVPEFHHVRDSERTKLKKLMGAGGKQPGRQVIAVSPARSLKWKSIEALLRDIQLKYPIANNDEVVLLDWRSA